MVKAVKVRKRNAEKVRKFLAKAKMINFDYLPASSKDFIFFPISEDKSARLNQLVGSGDISGIVSKKLESQRREKVSLPPFDIIGEVAIFELPKEYKDAIDSKKEKAAKEMGDKILAHHKNIKTAAFKTGGIKGPFRIRSFKIVSGKKSALTMHKEMGCRFMIDVSKAYYSPRLSFERKRINSIAKDGENVFVLFAGVGPFALIIAKNHPNSTVYANELNPEAYKHLKENIKLNKLSNVVPIPGDARKLAKTYKGTADRIVMPLPMSADEFLDVAFALARKNCMVHFYYFTSSIEKAEEKVLLAAKKARRKAKIVLSRRVRDYAPDILEAVVDFKVLN